jgi:hypothetical protein
MEDYSIHIHNVQETDVPSARARRKALQRSKSGIFTISLPPGKPTHLQLSDQNETED